MNPFRASHKTQGIRPQDPCLMKQTDWVCLQNSYDYSPFGVSLDGRTVEGDFYRRGFNGMEKDDEFKGIGNSYDFGARVSDPRIGKWFSRDIKEQLYPSMSVYNFTANNPIFYLDKMGQSISPANEKSMNDFNKTIQSLFSNNEIAMKIFTISLENKSLSNISIEDYNNALNSAQNIDQKAAIRSLFLATNSAIDYKFQSLEKNEEFSSNEFKGNTYSVEIASGYVVHQESDESVLIYVSLNSESSENIFGPVGESRSSKYFMSTTKRNADAMLLASIGTAYLKFDLSILGSSLENTFNHKGDFQLSAIQFENIAMRLNGLDELSGEDFKRPNGSEMGSDALNFVSQIPNQIKFQFIDYTDNRYLVNVLTGINMDNKYNFCNYNYVINSDSPPKEE